MSATTINRRSFLYTAGLSAALPAWFVEQLRAQPKAEEPKSATDKPNIALVGCGGRGRGVARDAARFGNVVAVCDVDSSHAEHAATKDVKGAKVYKDFRDVMKLNDVHIIINGTPDHWHTLVNL